MADRQTRQAMLDDLRADAAREGCGAELVGFVAVCKCGAVTGAVELNSAAFFVEMWLRTGRTVYPRYADNWPATVNPCMCSKPQQ